MDLVDEFKESLTIYDIERFMLHLGSPVKGHQGRDSTIFETICHNNDGEGGDKLYYYSDSHSFYCYTNCGSMSIYSLVQHYSEHRSGIEMSFPEAIEYVGNFFGRNLSQSNFLKIQTFEDWDLISDDWDIFKRKQRYNSKKMNYTIPIMKEIDESVFKHFHRNPHKMWIDDGISAKTQIKYEIMFDWRTARILIPHRDRDGRLIGIRGRATIADEEDGRKYMPTYLYNRDFSHKLGNNLYGLDKNKDNIKKSGKIIVFEAEKSVMKCEDYYGENNFSVAVCGSSISKIQKQLILESGAREMYIAFDKEYAFYGNEDSIKYLESLEKIASEFSPYINTYILLDYGYLLKEKDSPADRGVDVLEKLIKSKMRISTEIQT